MAQRTMSTKRERRQAAKLARLEAQRRARRRRALRTWGIPLAIVAVIVLVAFLTTRGDGEVATAGEVEVSGPPRTTVLEAGETFPAFSAPGLAGSRISWSPGTPSLISIWAPWCPSCRAEMPVIDRLAEEFPEIEMVTVATAADDRPGPSIAEFVEDGGISLPVALDDEDGTLARAMGIRGFPTLYFVDAEGVVLAAAEGQVEEEALRSALRETLSPA